MNLLVSVNLDFCLGIKNILMARSLDLMYWLVSFLICLSLSKHFNIALLLVNFEGDVLGELLLEVGCIWYDLGELVVKVYLYFSFVSLREFIDLPLKLLLAGGVEPNRYWGGLRHHRHARSRYF